MSRHPEPFEKHGITTRTLERAPLARQAFYTSDWPGARALVQSSDESKVKEIGCLWRLLRFERLLVYLSFSNNDYRT